MCKGIAFFMVAVALAGCSAVPHWPEPPDTPMRTPRIVAVLVPTADHAVNLEVHLIPSRDLGKAVLSVSGKNIKVFPSAQRQIHLKPPEPPPPVEHSPYPLRRVLIEVFRLESAERGTHVVKLHLSWKGGQLSREVLWKN